MVIPLKAAVISADCTSAPLPKDGQRFVNSVGHEMNQEE
jgi:hypothetical protein